MREVTISIDSVVEQMMALSALHGCLSAPDVPVMGADREGALRVMIRSLASTLMLSLRGCVTGVTTSDKEVTLTLSDSAEADTAALKGALEQWLGRMLAAQLWASAAPDLSRAAQAEAMALGDAIAAGMTRSVWPATVSAYYF